MNSIDAGRIVELMHDTHLGVAVAFYEGDRQLVVEYSDLKPHRNGEPRTQRTHIDALYTLMTARYGGVDYALSTGVPMHPGFLRLVFTKVRQGVKHA